MNPIALHDLAYAKEKLRAELASLFLMAERGIPTILTATPPTSAPGSTKQDKREIFRAAHRAADFLIALEHDKSIDKADARVNTRQPSLTASAVPPIGQVIQAETHSHLGAEMER